MPLFLRLQLIHESVEREWRIEDCIAPDKSEAQVPTQHVGSGIVVFIQLLLFIFIVFYSSTMVLHYFNTSDALFAVK